MLGFHILLINVIGRISNVLATECKQLYVSDTPPGVFYMLYPNNLNTSPYPGATLSNILSTLSFPFLPLYNGTYRDISLNIPTTVGGNQIETGLVFDNEITTTNFSMTAFAWLRVPVSGNYTFTIKADTAAEVYIVDHVGAYCCPPFDNNYPDQFRVTSIPAEPSLEIPTGTVQLYTGYSYELMISYMHFNGSAVLDISITDPAGIVHNGIGDFSTNMDLYDTTQLVTCDYGIQENTTIFPWTINITSTISTWSDFRTNSDGDITLYEVFIVGTPGKSTASISSEISTSLSTDWTFSNTSDTIIGNTNSYSDFLSAIDTIPSLSSEGFSIIDVSVNITTSSFPLMTGSSEYGSVSKTTSSLNLLDEHSSSTVLLFSSSVDFSSGSMDGITSASYTPTSTFLDISESPLVSSLSPGAPDHSATLTVSSSQQPLKASDIGETNTRSLSVLTNISDVNTASSISLFETSGLNQGVPKLSYKNTSIVGSSFRVIPEGEVTISDILHYAKPSDDLNGVMTQGFTGEAFTSQTHSSESWLGNVEQESNPVGRVSPDTSITNQIDIPRTTSFRPDSACLSPNKSIGVLELVGYPTLEGRIFPFTETITQLLHFCSELSTACISDLELDSIAPISNVILTETDDANSPSDGFTVSIDTSNHISKVEPPYQSSSSYSSADFPLAITANIGHLFNINLVPELVLLTLYVLIIV